MKRCIKHRHLSKGAAEAHIRGMAKIGLPEMERTYAYFCLCGYWHVGRKMKHRKGSKY